jgi:Pilus formation protein N terminal region
MAANGRTRLFALGVIVLLAGAAPARGAELLQIPLGFAEVVQVPGAGKEGKFTAIIGNPAIADFVYGPQNRFMFVGKARGTTNVVVLDNASGRELYNATIVVGGAAARPPTSPPALTGHIVKTYILAEKPRDQMFIRNYDCDPGCAILPPTSADRQAAAQPGGGEAEGAPRYAAPSGGIPQYDVARHCDRVARVGGPRSEVIYRQCIDNEQTAYDALKRDWATLPDEMRSHCDRIATVGGTGSYNILQTCIEQEQKAGRDNSMHRFVR